MAKTKQIMSEQIMIKSTYLFDENFSVLYYVMVLFLVFFMLKIPVRINPHGKNRHGAVDFSLDF